MSITKNPDLIRLLGEVDAIFSPVRDWSDNGAVAARLAAKSQYESEGRPIRRMAGDQAEQKRFERLLDQWESEKVVSVRRRNGKRYAWKLSPATYWSLRYATGEYGYWCAVQAAMCVAGHERLLQLEPQIQRVSELQIIGVAEGGDVSRRGTILQAMIQPALSLGWCTSHSDQDGRVAYQTTTRGHGILADPERHVPDAAEHDPRATAIYDQAYEATLAEMFRLAPSQANHVAVPLSCGLWDFSEDRSLHPFRLFRCDGKLREIRTTERAYRRLGVSP